MKTASIVKDYLEKKNITAACRTEFSRCLRASSVTFPPPMTVTAQYAAISAIIAMAVPMRIFLFFITTPPDQIMPVSILARGIIRERSTVPATIARSATSAGSIMASPNRISLSSCSA